MQLSVSSPRRISLARRLGKFGLFLTKGHSSGLAWWLAGCDAPKRQDYRSISKEALESASCADPSWIDIAATGGRISSRALNMEFQRDDIVSRGYPVWIALTQIGWKFTRVGSAGLLAQRGSLSLHLTTDEERDMITEIFLAGCYDVRLSGSWHVVDIGANIGMAALFFADQPWVQRVISFEPFAPTADAFMDNVRLNPDLAPKIALLRKALDESNKVLTVDYHPALRGSMSITGVGAWRGNLGASPQKVSIEVGRASTELAPILAARGACRLLGKIDCEGSEYGIFRDLEASGMLTEFSAFVIEWHGRGPEEIVRILQRNGFALHVSPLSPDQYTLGLIYATRLASDVRP